MDMSKLVVAFAIWRRRLKVFCCTLTGFLCVLITYSFLVFFFCSLFPRFTLSRIYASPKTAVMLLILLANAEISRKTHVAWN
jgi:hypothetical protein